MKYFSDIGIPFKQIDLKEADRIISILTKYHGRVDCIAKGVRKITSKKGGNIDIMSKSTFQFAKGKNLDIVIEAKLLDDFGNIKRNLNSTFDLFYVCEILNNFLQKDQKELQIFNYLEQLLTILNENIEKITIQAFILKILSNQGYQVNFTSCSECDYDLEENKKRYLSSHIIGFVCEKESERIGKPVDDKIVKTLKYLESHNLNEAARLELKEEDLQKLEAVLKAWLEIIFEKKIESKNI